MEMEVETEMTANTVENAGEAVPDVAPSKRSFDDSEDATPKELPFLEEELEACCKVFDAIKEDISIMERKELRMFRKKLAPLSEFLESRKFGGKGRKKYLEDKQLHEEKRARVNQRRMHDIKHINGSKLRRERLTKLRSLLEQDKDGVLPLIADGVAGEEECHTTMQSLCPDDSEQAKLEKAEAQMREDSSLFGFRSCYICKTRFDKTHHFYDQLCPRCAELNFTKRFQSSDMRGKVALVTGARVKIGYQVAVKLLLSGAAVIATSRFPKDAAARYAKHPEYETFKDRLQIFGIDFRDLVHLEQFTEFVLREYSRLDVIIHNACQTVRRPPMYYTHLMDKEIKSLEQEEPKTKMLLQHQQEFESQVRSMALTNGTATSAPAPSATAAPVGTVAAPSAMMSQVPLLLTDTHANEEQFPGGVVDVNGQQIDLRTKNTWLLKIGEVATPEVAEVFAINALAPFIMNNRLVPLMKRDADSTHRKFIVNVSAMEGKFYRYKTPNHPHTNMAKAALNMMTRTCAEDLAKNHIYMTSVDTGWINDENPLQKAHAHAQQTNFQTPIDEIDAAARVLDPVFDGYNSGKALFGKFLKDYHDTEW